MARPRLTKIDDPRSLGERLARLRRERGLSLRKLAFPGCSGAYISAIEKGRRVPSLQVLHELAKRLSVSPDFLATGERTPLEAQLVDAEMAVQLGRDDEARPRALTATVRLANPYTDPGDASHSATELAEALRESERLRDPMLRASVLWSQARFHTNQGRPEMAAGLAERALATLRANEDDR